MRHVIWWSWAPWRLATALAVGTVALLMLAAMVTAKRSWWDGSHRTARFIIKELEW